ncbi:type IV pilus modification protein PilV [Acinetobacter sp. MB5]|uniref:type IV pilus modification protein PilV n=1 Tax=Acinetobacter sp. MB5 TaxID=2069438 RepID=UPI000DCF8575|nr:type IV pilus modification protein PilV [Acinetobacter sp. MB5]
MQVKYQQGVGLLEVLVALLLLAIAVLGFVALQLRAVEATSEGFNRIEATNIARDLVEKIRINSSSTAITAYETYLSSQSGQAASVIDCYSTFCTPAVKAAFDVHEAYLSATDLGMTLNMVTCPGTANGRECIYVAWNKTDPVDTTATTSGHIACTTSETSSFSYNDSSTCIVMEAY